TGRKQDESGGQERLPSIWGDGCRRPERAASEVTFSSAIARPASVLADDAADVQSEFRLVARSADFDRQLRTTAGPTEERLRKFCGHSLPTGGRLLERGVEEQVAATIEQLALHVVRAGDLHDRTW